MAEEKRISRREFLKWFAVLSITSAGGVGCVCVPVAVYGPEPEYGPPPATAIPIAVEYGPPPVESPVVNRMTYIEKDGSEKTLHGSTDVPTNAQFVIYFSDLMIEQSQSAVTLSNIEGNDVSFETEWLQEDALKIVLTLDLQPGTEYVLEVGSDAESIHGESLRVTDMARAEFTTVE
jgi:hypothetical protein